MLCPNLRTFSTQDNSGDLTPLPRGTSSFATLERIYLEGMSREDMVDYVLWLSSGPELGRLTHFKIHVHDGLSDDITILLLDSFTRSGSPLQVLSLEGLAEAEFGLFDEIVRRFPNLRSLTLVRRASNGQTDNKTINWPHAAWSTRGVSRASRSCSISNGIPAKRYAHHPPPCCDSRKDSMTKVWMRTIGKTPETTISSMMIAGRLRCLQCIAQTCKHTPCRSRPGTGGSLAERRMEL